ncbi:hypothetical protein BJY52DRAFT_1226701 [Lactarius psammicola]|nr:hypothetical protein BJY52DRAFT_1226701 [Lactarius psammicola]
MGAVGKAVASCQRPGQRAPGGALQLIGSPQLAPPLQLHIGPYYSRLQFRKPGNLNTGRTHLACRRRLRTLTLRGCKHRGSNEVSVHSAALQPENQLQLQAVIRLGINIRLVAGSRAQPRVQASSSSPPIINNSNSTSNPQRGPGSAPRRIDPGVKDLFDQPHLLGHPSALVVSFDDGTCVTNTPLTHSLRPPSLRYDHLSLRRPCPLSPTLHPLNSCQHLAPYDSNMFFATVTDMTADGIGYAEWRPLRTVMFLADSAILRTGAHFPLLRGPLPLEDDKSCLLRSLPLTPYARSHPSNGA